MSDKSPVKKLKKDIKKSIETNTGSEVHNPMRIDWQKPHKGMIRHKENDDPKFVEREGKDEKEQNLAVIEQNDFQRNVTEMDKDTKRKPKLDTEVSATAGTMQFSKQPNKFGNPQDDELLRGAKKDNSKADNKVDLELDSDKPLHLIEKAVDLADKDGINIFEALRKIKDD